MTEKQRGGGLHDTCPTLTPVVRVNIPSSTGNHDWGVHKVRRDFMAVPCSAVLHEAEKAEGCILHHDFSMCGQIRGERIRIQHNGRVVTIVAILHALDISALTDGQLLGTPSSGGDTSKREEHRREGGTIRSTAVVTLPTCTMAKPRVS